MPLIEAIAQWYRIPMGVYAWPMFVLQTSYKLYHQKKIYEGEIGSSDFDDPFTQEEKIGKGGKPKPSQRNPQEELQRERDYSDFIGQDTREQDRIEYYDSIIDQFGSAGYGR
jgi:hypothetical protein